MAQDVTREARSRADINDNLRILYPCDEICRRGRTGWAHTNVLTGESLKCRAGRHDARLVIWNHNARHRIGLIFQTVSLEFVDQPLMAEAQDL